MYSPNENARIATYRSAVRTHIRESRSGVVPVAWRIGERLLQGLLLEVSTFSKPGLVCPASNGSHKDMSLMTFMAGSAAIAPALYLCADEGFRHEGDIRELLPKLRVVGIPYERRLLCVTKGVNTQRGALFAAGLIAGAAGFLAAEEHRTVEASGHFSSDTSKPLSLSSAPAREVKALSGIDFGDEWLVRASDICRVLSAMTHGLAERELSNSESSLGRKLTAGEQLFRKYGVKGIRGEVENGLPSVLGFGLPALEEAFARKADLNTAFVHALFSLMTCVEDTTILWRADWETLRSMWEKSRAVLAAGSVFTDEGRARISAMELDFLKENISPGGCADMLAVTIALYLMEHGSFPVAVR